MSDLVRRQDAIDVFEILADKMSDGGQTVMAQAVAVMKDLRSAGPEWALESAIDYLHSVGWLQEHDRILTESAEQERTAKVENIHQEYDLEGICFFDYGDCDNCGAQVQRGDRYCSECGCRLEWE